MPDCSSFPNKDSFTRFSNSIDLIKRKQKSRLIKKLWSHLRLQARQALHFAMMQNEAKNLEKNKLPPARINFYNNTKVER